MKPATIKLLATMAAVTLGVSVATPVLAQSGSPLASSVLGETVIHVDDANAIQDAIDALPEAGGEIIVAAGEFELDAPINMRGKSRVIIRGAGRQTVGDNAGTIIHANFAQADLPVFDLVGAGHCELSEFSIRQTEQLGHDPACAILLGKDAQDFAGLNTFSNLRILGRYEVASVINLGSEANTWSRCSFMNLTGQPSYWSSSWNTMGIESPFGEVRGGDTIGGQDAVNNLTQRFVDCTFGIPEDSSNPQRFAQSSAVRIEPVQIAIRFDHCAFVGPELSRAAVLVVGDAAIGQNVGGIWLNETRAQKFLGGRVIECTGDAMFYNIVFDGAASDHQRAQVGLTAGATLGQADPTMDNAKLIEQLGQAWDDSLALELASISGHARGNRVIAGIASGSSEQSSDMPEWPEVVQASLTDTEQNTIIEIVDIQPAPANNSGSAQSPAPVETPANPAAAVGPLPASTLGTVGFQSPVSQQQDAENNDDSENQTRISDGMPDVAFRDTPEQYILDSNTALRLNLSGQMPQGGDLLALVWSLEDNALVDDFAHLIDPDDARISMDHLNALTAGDYEIQLLVRLDNELVDRLTLALAVSEPAVETADLPLPTASFVQVPAQYEQGSSEAIAINLTGPLPQGSDILVLAWSDAEQRMVGEFAFVLDEDNPVIPSQQLDLLPVGMTNLQLLVRSDNVTNQRVTADIDVIEAVIPVPESVAFTSGAPASMTLGQAQGVAYEVMGDDIDACDIIVQAWSVTEQSLVAGFAYQAQADGSEIPASHIATLAQGEYILQLLLRCDNELVQQVDHALTISAPIAPPPPPPAPVDPGASFAPGVANSFEAGDNTSLAFSIVGSDLSDHDIVIQAWSIAQQRLVSEFAYTAPAASGNIPADRLALLPAGDNLVQVILRKNYAQVELAEHRLTVGGNADEETQQGSPDEEEDVPTIDIDDPDADTGDSTGDNTGDNGGTTDETGDNGGSDNDNGSGNADGGSGGQAGTALAGFTVFALPSDGRAIYVASNGSDSRDGRSPQTAVRSAERGFQLLRNNKPDHLLFRAGDTFSEGVGHWYKSGRSESQPMVIGVYGEGARPTFSISSNFLHTQGNDNVSHLAIMGIRFQNRDRVPGPGFNRYADATNAITWLGGGGDLLIEDCIVEGFRFGIVVNPQQDKVIEGMRLNRCIIRNCWFKGGDASGAFIKAVRNGVMTQCLFDHNGWIEGVAPRDPRRHNLYLAPRPNDPGDHRAYPWIIRGNLFTRGSSHGMKGGPGGTVEDNIWVQNAIAFYVSRNDSVIRGNIVIQSTDLDPDVGALRRGWGVEAFGMGSVIVENNIIANRDSQSHGHALKMQAGNVTYRGNIIHNWNRVDDYSADPDEIDYIFSGTMVADVGNFGNTFPGQYVDPDRDLGSYNASLGGSDSIGQFLAKVGGRDRGEWDDSLAQPAIESYIRDGFAVVPFD